jgi:hypothetical protein
MVQHKENKTCKEFRTMQHLVSQAASSQTGCQGNVLQVHNRSEVFNSEIRILILVTETDRQTDTATKTQTRTVAVADMFCIHNTV